MPQERRETFYFVELGRRAGKVLPCTMLYFGHLFIKLSVFRNAIAWGWACLQGGVCVGGVQGGVQTLDPEPDTPPCEQND